MTPTPAPAPGGRPGGHGRSGAPGLLRTLDGWMAQHPWHPRAAPLFVYLLFLPLLQWLTPLWPPAYLPLYAVQCGLVAWLLLRYRALLPELTLRFDWLAIPVGVGVVVAWVWLGQAIDHAEAVRTQGAGGFTRALWHWMADPALPGPGTGAGAEDAGGPAFAGREHAFLAMAPPVRAAAMGMHLLGMSLLVPLFEELFDRSLLLRSLSGARATLLGLIQVLEDVPLLGEMLAGTAPGRRAAAAPPVFARQFEVTPLGRLTPFGVAASTVIFMLMHARRDWPGCVVCGVAYCLLLAATRRKGLGPTAWAHGITNALLWGYTVWTGDWRFL